jgi:hypothetical protein
MTRPGVAEPRYTIRLRYAGRRGCVAFVIEDQDGDAYIYTRRGLSCCLIGRYCLPAFASTLHRLGWVPVPSVRPYTLDALRRLLGLLP